MNIKCFFSSEEEGPQGEGKGAVISLAMPCFILNIYMSSIFIEIVKYILAGKVIGKRIEGRAALSLARLSARKKVGRRVEALLFTIIFHNPVNRPTDPKGPSQAPLI